MPPKRPVSRGDPGVVEVDRVLAPALERLGKVDEDRVQLALVLQLLRAEQDLVDLQVVVEVELDARVVLQHLEADRVLAAEELLVRIDADVEVVGEQIVVGAIAAVLAAQDVGARRTRPASRGACAWRRAAAAGRGRRRLVGRRSPFPAATCRTSRRCAAGVRRGATGGPSARARGSRREAHHHRRPLEVLQRAEQLLAAGGGRRPVVLLAEDEHQRRLDLRRRR